MQTRTVLSAVIASCLLGTTVRAEKADMSPAQLLKTSTHVVVSEVRAIYSRKQTVGEWEYTNYVAEIRVDKIEKGGGLKEGDLAYVRYWTRLWTGKGLAPASTSGHRGLPSPGEVVRLYLSRNAYDGFTRDNSDGGYNVVGANGFEGIESDSQETR